MIIPHHTEFCVGCEGSGEITTATPYATTSPHFAGWAYDETTEQCPSCNGSGLDAHWQDESFEDAAAWHAAIQEGATA